MKAQLRLAGDRRKLGRHGFSSDILKLSQTPRVFGLHSRCRARMGDSANKMCAVCAENMNEPSAKRTKAARK